MKRTFFSLAILVSISITSFASTENAEQKKGRRDFPKELKLSDEQKAQMKEINKDFDQKIEAVKKSRIVAEVQQERIRTLRDEKREAVANILTPEQKAQFQKRMTRGTRGDKKQLDSKRRSSMTHNHNWKGHTKHRGHHKMFENLNLTDAQKDQIKSLREKFAIERRESATKHKNEMMKVLTPEQQKQLETNRSKFVNKSKERKETMGRMKKLDEADKTKLKELRTNYIKQKEAIENSRIAPDMQKQKLQILKENFEKDKRVILDSAK